MERIDDTGFGGIRVIQTKGSGYGVDAVLLAAFAAGESGAKGIAKNAGRAPRIADLGTGCGIAAFILHHKLGGARITGIEVNPAAAERAARACLMNGLEHDVDFIRMDVKETAGRGDLHGIFDAVVTNPPYFRRTPDEPGAAFPDERYTARHETTAGITDFSEAASLMLRAGGSLYMVHRPDRLADIFSALRSAGLEPKDMQLVTPVPGAAANIVLIHAVKGAGSELHLLPEIAVHLSEGGYTDEILSFYERERKLP